MTQQKVIAALNWLLSLHSRSMAMYLASAPPWVSAKDTAAASVLRHMADDQRLMADRIASVVLDEGGEVMSGEFPMTYTDLHDLSIDYLVPQVVAQQKADLESIREIVQLLKDAPVPRAVAEEALGAAQAHLDSLAELPQSSFALRA